VSCNNILYLIVTHKRLGNVLYKWDWPTITDLTEELKVTNANPPLVGSKSKLLFYNDEGNVMLVDSGKWFYLHSVYITQCNIISIACTNLFIAHTVTAYN